MNDDLNHDPTTSKSCQSKFFVRGWSDSGCSKRLLLFGGSSVAALFLLFFAVIFLPIAEVIRWATLPCLAVLLVLLVNAILKTPIPHVFRLEKEKRQIVVLSLIAAIYVHLQIPNDYKVIYDEQSLLSTALGIYQTHSVTMATTIRVGHGDTYLLGSSETHLDKRPALYPAIVAFLHHLLGYRIENALLWNAFLTPVALWFVYIITWSLCRKRWAGVVALISVASFPAFTQIATSHLADLTNLVAFLATIFVAIRFWKNPTNNGAMLFFASASLLAFARYESALYIFAVGTVWIVACWKEKQVFLSNACALVPITLIPAGLLFFYIRENEKEFFQHEMLGLERTLSAAYLDKNMSSLFDFLFIPNVAVLNSPLVFWVLLPVFFLGVIRGLKSCTRRDVLDSPLAPAVIILLFAVLNLIILLFYLWGNVTDVAASRIVLPQLSIFIIIASALMGKHFDIKYPAFFLAFYVPGCMIFGQASGSNHYVYRVNINHNLANVAKAMVVDRLNPRDVVFTNKPGLFVPDRVVVFSYEALPSQLERLQRLQVSGALGEIYIFTEDSVKGDVQMPLEQRVRDQFPKARFESLDYKRNGPGVHLELSRLILIDSHIE